MGRAFDIFIIAASLICGVLLLTGNGGFLLKTGNAKNNVYDEEKLSKASGIFLLLVGALTLADVLVTNPVFSMVYLVVVIIVFAGFIFFITRKCKK